MRPLGIIVLIVLVDLLGFTLVMPLLGPFAKHYQFSGWQIGLLFSAYPVGSSARGPPDPAPDERSLRPPAALEIFSQGGNGSFVSHPRPLLAISP